tara:strand:+ start:875 stop:1873 length:999 start_codon:yes stop_codon:yes gene_type:complete
MSTAVIVLNWNDWKNTIDCLESIFQNNEKFDVVFIDNGSTYNHFSKIIQWTKGEIVSNSFFIKPKIKKIGKIIEIKKNFDIQKKNLGNKNLFIIKNKVNYGLTKGLNIGYKFAIRNNYKYILRIDNDFIINKNYISQILETIKKPNIVAASPKIMHAYIKNSVWFSGFKMSWSYLKFQRTMNLQKKRVYDNPSLNKIIETDMVCGCCSAYKVAALRKSGLGDEEIFYGPEDFELSHRLKKIGKIVCNQKIITYHKIGRSSSIEKKENRIFQSTYGFLIIIKKMGTLSDKLIGYTYINLRLFFYIVTFRDYKFIRGYFCAIKKFFFNKLWSKS